MHSTRISVLWSCYGVVVRTTVTLDEDVARAIEQLRRERGLGSSAALNLLARRGLAESGSPVTAFTQRVSSMGRPRVPLDDIGGALDVLEDEAPRE